MKVAGSCCPRLLTVAATCVSQCKAGSCTYQQPPLQDSVWTCRVASPGALIVETLEPTSHCPSPKQIVVACVYFPNEGALETPTGSSNAEKMTVQNATVRQCQVELYFTAKLRKRSWTELQCSHPALAPLEPAGSTCHIHSHQLCMIPARPKSFALMIEPDKSRLCTSLPGLSATEISASCEQAAAGYRKSAKQVALWRGQGKRKAFQI